MWSTATTSMAAIFFLLIPHRPSTWLLNFKMRSLLFLMLMGCKLKQDQMDSRWVSGQNQAEKDLIIFRSNPNKKKPTKLFSDTKIRNKGLIGIMITLWPSQDSTYTRDSPDCMKSSILWFRHRKEIFYKFMEMSKGNISLSRIKPLNQTANYIILMNLNPLTFSTGFQNFSVIQWQWTGRCGPKLT